MVTRRTFIGPGVLSLQISLLILLALTGSPLTALATPLAAEPEKFSNKAFETVWQRVDQPIFARKTDRSWYWGPEPLAGGLYEPYAEAPYGRRLVQYFDKARMEINDPSKGQITNGLLVVEMITGRVQQGDETFDEQSINGADVPVAGDLSNSSPTYRQLAKAYNISTNLQVREAVTRLWQGDSPASQTYNRYSLDAATRVATVQEGFGVPQAFWEFMNRKGVVYNGGSFTNDLISDWRFSIGLPVTEAYWTRVKVDNIEKDVLFQAFERRVLTYTPDNDAAFQVEMGNVGLHYLQWRYKGNLPQYENPLLSIFDGTNQNQPLWYKTTEVLNIRTAPNAKASLPFSSKTRPFVTQLQPGDRLKVLRAVKGEEVEPGNDLWYQIYEKPDLFVYSKYTERLQIPTFPTPPRSYKGLWVAISLNKQMMAIYNNQERILTTLVATGRSGYETVTGSFKAIGGWRPLSQVMEGGNRAAGDGYRLEEVRNVTYFFRDFAIHGSYWHAKYGIAPQSHGCVNATVYDAGLVHQLPVGTPIEVF